MRFTLRMGGREVLVMSRDRFVRFDGLEAAAEWVADYVVSPQNLHNLRAALAQDRDFAELLVLDLAELIVRVAALMLDGRLRWLYEPRAQTPWSWQLPETPSTEIEEVSSDTEITSLTGEAEKAEEEESEYEEVKPEPVIPPEYPRLAKREADAVDYSAKKMGFELDLLRFIGEKPVPDSRVAEAQVDVARAQMAALEQAAMDAAAPLEGLARVDGLNPPKSNLAATFPAMVEAQNTFMRGRADVLGVEVESNLAGADFHPPESELAAEFPELASSQKAALTDTAVRSGEQLDVLSAPAGDPPAPGTVGPAFPIEAERGRTALSNAAASMGEDLARTLDGPPADPPAPSALGVEFKASAEYNGKAIGDRASALRGDLATLTEGERADHPGPTIIGGVFTAGAKVQSEALEDKVVTIGRDMESLKDAPGEPPLPRHSLVGEDARTMAKQGAASFDGRVKLLSSELDKL